MSFARECRLTPRSSRAPTACHAGPAGGTRYIFATRARASHRWCRLNSNVRPQRTRVVAKLDLKIPPLAVWAVFAVAIAAAAHWLPSANLRLPGHQVLAVIVVLAGIAVALAGVVEFGRAKTTVNPLAPDKATSVVTTGVYRLTRNPMYVGMAAVLMGIALWWASLPGLLFLAAFCAYITRFQIQPEERALLARFGEEFTSYMSRVRRWV